jgi:chromosome segregation ATPase
MSKFGFLVRKSGRAEQPVEPAAASDNPLDLDDELFSARGAQPVGEDEALRSLLLDAHDKIGEIDAIKAAFRKLIEPVGKALGDFEAYKTEKAELQSALDTTRTAYGKLRNEVGDIDKKLAQQTGECLALREENRQLGERLTEAAALESELAAARQRLLAAANDKRAQQVMLDKAGAETARLSRKLAETETNVHAAQSLLRQAEADLGAMSTERTRLATALEETKARHAHELATQASRYDALGTRTAALEKVVADARELLLARAGQIHDQNQRAGELMAERDALQAQLTGLQTELRKRESELKDVDQARTLYAERNATLARAVTVKEAELARAGQATAALHERIGALETAHDAERQTTVQIIEELGAGLRREKMERAALEDALAAAREAYAQAMHEVMALRRNPPAGLRRPRAANAA